ncbi:MAG: AbrB/MazE/SpoVT family DNA-binding domain-containing protein [Armatimonadota bacterium]
MPIRAHVKVSSKGQITLPASVRREMRIRPGDLLTLHAGDDAIELRPTASGLRRLRGCMKGAFGTMDEIVESIRKERDSWEE